MIIIIQLWFAWKFVPLWYQQQLRCLTRYVIYSCDLLENSYPCGISNNQCRVRTTYSGVVICLKIRTFVVSATTARIRVYCTHALWFAWKFVPLWYQQQPLMLFVLASMCCDLLENSYLCGISNNGIMPPIPPISLWFAWKFVPLWYQQQLMV